MEREIIFNPKFIKDENISSETYLWKYLDLQKFLYFLINESLYFTRVDKFEDNREGINIEQLFLKTIKRKLDKSNTFTQLAQLMTVDNMANTMNKIEDELKIIQRFNFANCWFLEDNNKESVAMWNLYSNPHGIAIKIKYSDFKNKFSTEEIIDYGQKEEVICSPVEYIDFLNINKVSNPSNENIKNSIFLKDLSFMHEREFRIIIKEKIRKIPNLEYKENISRKHLEKLYNENYNYSGIPIKLNNFQDYNFEIILHPKSEEWIKNNIRQLVKTLKINFQISESELDLK